MTRSIESDTADGRERLIERLCAERCSCVIRSGSEVRIFRERGVKDLYRLLVEEPQFLDGAFVADKVVGKGAAALMILGGVEEVFAGVISTPALELLRAAQIRVEYTVLTPQIVNRTGTGRCPVERLCDTCRTAEECLPRIEEFLRKTATEQTGRTAADNLPAADSHPEDPATGDIGMLASPDSAASEMACTDPMRNTDNPTKAQLLERIGPHHDRHTLESAEAIGPGSRKYELINLD